MNSYFFEEMQFSFTFFIVSLFSFVVTASPLVVFPAISFVYIRASATTEAVLGPLCLGYFYNGYSFLQFFPSQVHEIPIRLTA